MADDYYRFLDATHTLRGENTRKAYRLGDKVRVQVIRVDLEKRQIELGTRRRSSSRCGRTSGGAGRRPPRRPPGGASRCASGPRAPAGRRR